MFHNRGSRVVSVFTFACAVLLMLSASIPGCGGDRSSESKATIETVKRSTPAPAAEPQVAQAAEEKLSSTEQEEAVNVSRAPRLVTYEEAEEAYNEKRYGDAVKLFTQYTERKDENPWGYYMLGLSSWKAGDNESAKQAFQQAIQLDPRHVKSYLNLSRVFLDMNEPEKALEELDKALEIDPSSSVAYRLRGRAYHEMGEREKAIAAYRHAVGIDDRDAWSMNNMGLIFIEEGLYEKALPPLALAVELDGSNGVFLNNLGMALERSGRFRAAEKAYKSATETENPSEKAVANLERIEGVSEESDLEPIDLGAVAESFVAQVESWKVKVTGVEKSDSIEPEEVVSEADTFSISIADTTKGRQE